MAKPTAVASPTLKRARIVAVLDLAGHPRGHGDAVGSAERAATAVLGTEQRLHEPSHWERRELHLELDLAAQAFDAPDHLVRGVVAEIVLRCPGANAMASRSGRCRCRW